MGKNDSMTSIEVHAGTVTITEETIQIDIGPFGALKRFYEQSKLIVTFLIGCFLLMVLVFLLDPGPYYRTLSEFTIVFTTISFSLGVIYPKLRNNIKHASEISRTTIHRVEYTTGSRLFAPKIRIIVDDGVVTGVRPIPLSHQRLGGDQQLEQAIQAFEDAGIDIVPADEVPGADS